MPIFKYVNKNFFKKWSPEMVYVLGFFAADGNLSINKRGGCYIAFHSKDRQIMSEIKKVLLSKNKLEKRFSHQGGGFYYRLQIGSKDMVEDLLNLGFNTNKIKHLPFVDIPKDLFNHFVRGYFDGDGNIWSGFVHKDRKTKHMVLQLAFTSGSELFLSNLKKQLNYNLSTNGSHVLSKKGSYSRIQYSTNDALKIYNYMYNVNGCHIYLHRKKRQFDKYIKMRS